MQSHSAICWVTLATIILPELLSETIQQGLESMVEKQGHLRAVVVRMICSCHPFNVPKLCLDPSVSVSVSGPANLENHITFDRFLLKG